MGRFRVLRAGHRERFGGGGSDREVDDALALDGDDGPRGARHLFHRFRIVVSRTGAAPDGIESHPDAGRATEAKGAPEEGPSSGSGGRANPPLPSCVSISPCGGAIATGHNDKTIRLWSAENGKLIRQLACRGSVAAIEFSEATIVGSNGEDDGEGGDRKSPDPKTEEKLPRIVLVSCSDWSGGELSVWTVGPAGGSREIALPHEGIRGVAVHGKSQRLTAASLSAQSVCIWENSAATMGGKGKWNLKFKLGAGYEFEGRPRFSTDGKQLAASCGLGNFHVWSAETGRLTQIYDHRDAVTAIQYTPCGSMIASGDHENLMHLWRLRDAKRVHSFRNRHYSHHVCHRMQFVPNGMRMVEGCSLGLTVWNVPSGEILDLRERRGGVSDVALSSDGTGIVCLNAMDKSIDVWELKDYNRLFDVARRDIPKISMLHKDLFMALIGEDALNEDVWADMSLMDWQQKKEPLANTSPGGFGHPGRQVDPLQLLSHLETTRERLDRKKGLAESTTRGFDDAVGITEWIRALEEQLGTKKSPPDFARVLLSDNIWVPPMLRGRTARCLNWTRDRGRETMCLVRLEPGQKILEINVRWVKSYEDDSKCLELRQAEKERRDRAILKDEEEDEDEDEDSCTRNDEDGDEDDDFADFNEEDELND